MLKVGFLVLICLSWSVIYILRSSNAKESKTTTCKRQNACLQFMGIFLYGGGCPPTINNRHKQLPLDPELAWELFPPLNWQIQFSQKWLFRISALRSKIKSAASLPHCSWIWIISWATGKEWDFRVEDQTEMTEIIVFSMAWSFRDRLGL